MSTRKIAKSSSTKVPSSTLLFLGDSSWAGRCWGTISVSNYFYLGSTPLINHGVFIRYWHYLRKGNINSRLNQILLFTFGSTCWGYVFIYILFWQTNWNDGICHMSYSKWLWLSYGFDYLSGHQVVVDPMFTHASAQKVIQNLLHSPTREPGSWKAACTFVHVSINNPHSGCSAKIWVEEAFCCTR